MRRNRQNHRSIQCFLLAALMLGTPSTGASGQPAPQPSLRTQLEHLEGPALRADVENEDRTIRQVRRLERDVERLRAAGRYVDALPLQHRVLEIVERERGRDRIWTLGEAHYLAELYQALGRYGEAEALYQRVLEAQLRLDGEGSMWTLRTFNSLAVMYQLQGRLDESEQTYRRAIQASEREAGPGHPRTLALVNNLATSLISQGRYADAQEHLGRALEAADRQPTSYSDTWQTTATNLAVALQELGRLREAETLFRRVLAANEWRGPQHSATRAARANLTTLQQLMRQRGQTGPVASSPTSPSVEGPTCMVVTDIDIIDGQEMRTPKQLCRTPPSQRWVRV